MTHIPVSLYPRHVYRSGYWDARTGLPLRGGIPLRVILLGEFWRLILGPLLDCVLRRWIENAEVPPAAFDGRHYFDAPRVAWPYLSGQA